ncbi:nuclear transport factor 2 family protein [Sphingomonas sp. BIUV-7]|uniref:Nuclear transport factor 2 family protein n=1 Tax=Sphingomonas natans TaxID=3063330 RepID=A0ABT8Y8C2_9SPHN|nr:nuclear transport factor 2 family protein [Sphingomonas sp. BIUV-7]MDO6414564.1 nuclear transport factor 2 family protein [Sphingomonas sp. BIUV-7]
MLGLFEAWHRLDLESVMLGIARDAIFLPDPGAEPVRGYEAIRTLWARYMSLFQSYRCEVRTILSSDRLVLMERVEHILRVDGQVITIPVAAAFELDADGKITSWRDYWDPAVAKPAP